MRHPFPKGNNASSTLASNVNFKTMSDTTDKEFISVDLFAGDRDVIVEMETNVLLVTRKEHDCYIGFLDHIATPHKIPKGSRCRRDKAFVDGAWCSYYMCLPCLEKCIKMYK